ncbi:MAG TPA: class I SAM-dependent methyltransferase [Methylomirabilota bacterium]|nr:class I SAM-dependent methyltransferase [Methylomirabilota bacterium]
MTGLAQALLRHYARAEAAAVAPFVAGRTVLDLGAGEGYVGPEVAALTGARVCSVDVGAFRRAPGAYVIYDGARLPFADRTPRSCSSRSTTVPPRRRCWTRPSGSRGAGWS